MIRWAALLKIACLSACAVQGGHAPRAVGSPKADDGAFAAQPSTGWSYVEGQEGQYFLVGPDGQHIVFSPSVSCDQTEPLYLPTPCFDVRVFDADQADVVTYVDAKPYIDVGVQQARAALEAYFSPALFYEIGETTVSNHFTVITTNKPRALAPNLERFAQGFRDIIRAKDAPWQQWPATPNCIATIAEDSRPLLGLFDMCVELLGHPDYSEDIVGSSPCDAPGLSRVFLGRYHVAALVDLLQAARGETFPLDPLPAYVLETAEARAVTSATTESRRAELELYATCAASLEI